MPFGIRPSNVRVCHFTTRATGKPEVCRSGIGVQGKNFTCWAVGGMGFSQVPTEEINLMAYAVIQTGGKQYRVAEGDVIEVERLDVEAGADATFDQVLLVSNGESVSIGAPLVSGAAVTAEVVEQTKAPKVIAFKYKRRKGYHRTVGHRRQLTRLKIKTISA
jgi:large subunit ribosomal protein L21